MTAVAVAVLSVVAEVVGNGKSLLDGEEVGFADVEGNTDDGCDVGTRPFRKRWIATADKMRMTAITNEKRRVKELKRLRWRLREDVVTICAIVLN